MIEFFSGFSKNAGDWGWGLGVLQSNYHVKPDSSSVLVEVSLRLTLGCDNKCFTYTDLQSSDPSGTKSKTGFHIFM